jgi:hypothetical protein
MQEAPYARNAVANPRFFRELAQLSAAKAVRRNAAA